MSASAGTEDPARDRRRCSRVSPKASIAGLRVDIAASGLNRYRDAHVILVVADK